MVITTDIPLRGTAWNDALERLSPFFANKTNYSLFLLSLSIGIMYDQRIEKPIEGGEEQHSVPRNVIRNNDNGKLDFMFQAAILSTQTENMTEERRLELAFGEATDFNKLAFLTQFANFGVTKLVEQIGATPIETMTNIQGFLTSTVEGRNLDINNLPDDIFFDE